MWGAAIDPNDTTDSYHGFTEFKMRFGGEHILYMDSFDFVVNPFMYYVFNLANKIRWIILKALK